jgi:hypothetical protein
VSNATGYVQEDFAATDDLYLSFRLRLPALSSGSPRVVMLANGGTTTGNFVLTSTGRLRLRVGSTTVGVDSAPLQAGVTYRVGLHQRRGTGSNAIIEAFLAADGAAFGAPFARSTTGTWTTAADRLRIGATNGSAVNIVVDDVILANGVMPTSAPAGAGIILVAAIDAPAVSITLSDVTRSSFLTTPFRYLVCPI